jgi:hypothetical protein
VKRGDDPGVIPSPTIISTFSSTENSEEPFGFFNQTSSNSLCGVSANINTAKNETFGPVFSWYLAGTFLPAGLQYKRRPRKTCGVLVYIDPGHLVLKSSWFI